MAEDIYLRACPVTPFKMTFLEGKPCFDIAGAGLIRDPATEIRAWAVWDLVAQQWICERIW
jgi:hypothetical protein